jgi:hypothetical protein
MSLAHRLIAVTAIVVTASSVRAEQIPAGDWKQTSSNMGDCATCSVKVARVSPDIIQLKGNSDWVGYLHYVRGEDRYRGALQWEAGKGETYENVLFIAEVVYDGKTFTLSAKSANVNMTGTYRAK